MTKHDPKRACVIGGAGFLGSHVADQLTDAGYSVRIYDRVESKWRRADQQRIVGDVMNLESLSTAVAGRGTAGPVTGCRAST